MLLMCFCCVANVLLMCYESVAPLAHQFGACRAQCRWLTRMAVCSATDWFSLGFRVLDGVENNVVGQLAWRFVQTQAGLVWVELDWFSSAHFIGGHSTHGRVQPLGGLV